VWDPRRVRKARANQSTASPSPCREWASASPASPPAPRLPARPRRTPPPPPAPPASPAEPRCGPHWLVPARGHAGHSHHHGGDGGGETSERIFRLGLAADVALTAGKAVTGYLSGSTAIVADAAHSLSDIVRV